MRWNPTIGSASIVFFGVVSLLTPSPLFAQALTDIALSVPSFSQQLLYPDTNGDFGTYDCAAAAEYMVLQTLFAEKKLNQEPPEYSNIRQELRASPLSSNLSEGIDLRDVVSLTPFFTNNQLQAQITQTTSQQWQTLLRSNLAKGFPVIVHVSDWTRLPNHASDAPTSHAIVVSGIDNSGVYYNDSWDGSSNHISFAEFEQAWNNSPHAFYAIVFHSNKIAHNIVHNGLFPTWDF